MTATEDHHTDHQLAADHAVEPVAWKESPIDRRGLGIMFATFLIGTAILTPIGLALVEWWDTGSAGRVDADINRWIENRRTEQLTTLAEVGSAFSDTITKVLLGVVLIPVFLWLFRRWHEYAFIFGGLVVEVCVFGLTSRLVGRERPPVEQLDGAPTDSFPSGHIAAATVFYGGLAVIIYMRSRGRGERMVAVSVAALIPPIVIASRLYLGMHYVTDAVAGVALGLTVLIVMYRVVFGQDAQGASWRP